MSIDTIDRSALLDEADATASKAAAALGGLQNADGHWVFELEADATIPAEYVLLRHYLGEPRDAEIERKIAAKRAELDRACEANGRDPCEIATSTQALFFVLDSNDDADAYIQMVAGRPCVAGTPDRIAESVAAWREAGVDEIIVPDFTLGRGAERTDALDRIIEEVAPAFR